MCTRASARGSAPRARQRQRRQLTIEQSWIPSFEQTVDQSGERPQAIVAALGVVVRMRALGVGQLRSVFRRLELMALVPFVERVDVHEKESLPRVRERRTDLQPDRRLKR